MKWVIVFLMIVVSLTACGGAADEGTERPLPTQFQAPSTATPLEVDTSNIDPGTFTLTVSGTENVTITDAAFYEDLVAVGISLNLLTFPDDTIGTGVVIGLPVNIQTGNYTVRTMADVRDPFTQSFFGIGGMYVREGEPGDDFPIYSYDNISRGSLTLTSVFPFTGAFQFTAQDTRSNVIEVSGTFNEIDLDSATTSEENP